jgi:hypothetical protein
MAETIVGSTTGNGAEVNADHALLVSPRPPAFGALGLYRMAAVTGAIAATLAANGTLFEFQWTSSANLALIQSVKVGGIVASTITTGVLFDASLLVARSFTAADTGGTTLTPSGLGVTNTGKLRTSMGVSLVNDMRIATTATLTPGTRTLDSEPIGRIQGFTGTALGTQIFAAPNPAPLYIRDNDDHHPLCLAQNEGFVIQNPLAGPATGTITLLVEIEWAEVASYP